MDKYRRCVVGLVGLTMLLGVLLVSCGGPTVKVGWVGSTGARSIAYRYRTFTGVERKRARLEAGETLVLDYEVTVAEGALTLQVQAPAGEAVWEATFREDESGTVEETVERGGAYEIVILGESTQGSFELSWEIE
jgi:hypothetical protein